MVAGAAVVTGSATVTAAGVATGATGSGVATVVDTVWAGVVVLDVQPAKNAETRSSPQTIPIRMSDCARDGGCMMIFLCT